MIASQLATAGQAPSQPGRRSMGRESRGCSRAASRRGPDQGLIASHRFPNASCAAGRSAMTPVHSARVARLTSGLRGPNQPIRHRPASIAAATRLSPRRSRSPEGRATGRAAPSARRARRSPRTKTSSSAVSATTAVPAGAQISVGSSRASARSPVWARAAEGSAASAAKGAKGAKGASRVNFLFHCATVFKYDRAHYNCQKN